MDAAPPGYKGNESCSAPGQQIPLPQEGSAIGRPKLAPRNGMDEAGGAEKARSPRRSSRYDDACSGPAGRGTIDGHAAGGSALA